MNTFGLILGVSFIIIGISLLSTYKGFTEKFKDKEDKNIKNRDLYIKNLKIIEKKKKTQAVAMIIVGCVILAVSAMPRTYKTTTRSATCKVCHREFTDSDDVESIKHTNMCSNCYDNYEFGNDVREAEKNYENGK